MFGIGIKPWLSIKLMEVDTDTQESMNQLCLAWSMLGYWWVRINYVQLYVWSLCGVRKLLDFVRCSHKLLVCNNVQHCSSPEVPQWWERGGYDWQWVERGLVSLSYRTGFLRFNTCAVCLNVSIHGRHVETRTDAHGIVCTICNTRGWQNKATTIHKLSPACTCKISFITCKALFIILVSVIRVFSSHKQWFMVIIVFVFLQFDYILWIYQTLA